MATASEIRLEIDRRNNERDAWLSIESIARDFLTLVSDPDNQGLTETQTPNNTAKFGDTLIITKLIDLWRGTDALFIELDRFGAARMGRDFILRYLTNQLNAVPSIAAEAPNGVSWAPTSTWKWFDFATSNTFDKRVALRNLLLILGEKISQTDQEISELSNDLIILTRDTALAPPTPPSSNQTGTALNSDLTRTIFNVGAVRGAYFNTNSDFRKIVGGELNSNNRPAAVQGASQLWRDSKSHKGMIQIYIPPTGQLNIFDTVAPGIQPVQQLRYGFQFHYNPGSIDMSYSGSPNIDVNMEATGQERFNLYGTSVSTSTISIQLVLNRVLDHQYYDKTGFLLEKYRGVYSPRTPTEEEQLRIFERGTMYDVEALLATLVGFKAQTDLRGETADVGWITGRTLEIHLGKALRYRGFIGGVGVRHIMFTEQMVPIFSTIQMDIRRIPDYAGLGGPSPATGSGGSSGSGSDSTSGGTGGSGSAGGGGGGGGGGGL
jgi:hypothetical protein